MAINTSIKVLRRPVESAHPMADWRAQRATRQVHFQRLFEEFQIVVQRSMLSGLHVHAEMPMG
ncbi:hypothetical protein ALO94_02413 [Pseudomonas syringae pv. spinaceae]|uniref:Uncharacterized protein n=1 Tax=Pseudomonas syringae pv. spinaceae TaxID=264459 RepID=A0A0P9ZGW0_PSESX|nr:hypothetical protein ALO94_02413 [Pseudomonas syringae pv. spinaceae]